MLLLIASTLALAPATFVRRAPYVGMAAGHHSSELKDLRAEIERLRDAAKLADSNLRVAVAACGAAEMRAKLLQQELTQLKMNRPEEAQVESISDPRVSLVFDAVDEDGNGVLDLDEFRKGYAMLTGDAVQAAFEAIDDNDDGVLTKEEFQKGYALLTSDSARAAAERDRVQRAVETERVRAVKEAAKILAEAQLLDALQGDSQAGRQRFPAQYRPVPGRKPLPRRNPKRDAPLSPAAADAYAQYGPLPDGFDIETTRHLVNARVRAKAARDYQEADRLQAKLIQMGVRLDDRWRTWSVEGTVALARKEYDDRQREEKERVTKSPRAQVVPTTRKKPHSVEGSASAMRARARVNRALKGKGASGSTNGNA